MEREHVLDPLRRSIVARTVLLAPRHLFKVRRATGAHPVRHQRPPSHVFSARVAPAVVLLHARGAIHDEVRRHATTLHSTISITVLGIAVLLIRCACCLVWIPFVVRAVVTSRAASFSLSRSGIRLSRRDMIAAAGDDASLLALSRRALITALFAALFRFPRTFPPLQLLFSLFLAESQDRGNP